MVVKPRPKGEIASAAQSVDWTKTRQDNNPDTTYLCNPIGGHAGTCWGGGGVRDPQGGNFAPLIALPPWIIL